MNATDAHKNSATAMLSDLSGSDKHCIFRYGQSWFSLPAISVREITIAPDLVKVPNCDQSLAGLCHLRSEFIPVISLTQLLSVDASQNSGAHDNLMVINGHSVWALLIAEVAALESLETLVAPEGRSDDMNPTPVTGTAMFRDQIVSVLDPNIIFRIVHHSLETHWRGAQNSILDSHREQGSKN